LSPFPFIDFSLSVFFNIFNLSLFTMCERYHSRSVKFWKEVVVCDIFTLQTNDLKHSTSFSLIFTPFLSLSLSLLALSRQLIVFLHVSTAYKNEFYKYFFLPLSRLHSFIIECEDIITSGRESGWLRGEVLGSRNKIIIKSVFSHTPKEKGRQAAVVARSQTYLNLLKHTFYAL
jgi:hypothetical protein